MWRVSSEKYSSTDSVTVVNPQALHSDQPHWRAGMPRAGYSLLTLPRTVSTRSVRAVR